MAETWMGPDPQLRSRFFQPQFAVRIGQVDISEFATHVEVFEESRLPQARVTLSDAPRPRFDYLAELAIIRPGTEDAYFGGTITSARPDPDGGLVITATSVSELRERNVSPFASSRVGPADLIHMHVRGAGFARDRIDIGDQWRPKAEVVEVAVPVFDCDVRRATAVGSVVRFVPMPQGLLSRFANQTAAIEALRPTWSGAGALAVTYASDAVWMSDAEEQGLAAISRALDWLVVLMRNGQSVRDGVAVAFERDDLRAYPRLSTLALVTGMQSGRSWVRDTREPTNVGAAQLDKILQSAPLPRGDARSLQSYAAFRRAADEQLPTPVRVAAIWETLEYYAADVQREPVFEKRELRAIRKSAAAELSDAQRRRLDYAIAQLNSASLQERIWLRASTDGVHVSRSDREIIAKTREYRNTMVHGGFARTPTRNETNYAVSVVSRLLLEGAREG